MKKEQQPIPKIGETYHFFDDGKTSASRHYICRVEEIITPKQAKNIILENSLSLYDFWRNEVDRHRQDYNSNVTMVVNGVPIKPGEPYFYAEETDYFIRITCPNYSEGVFDLWAVRTINGGWFTINPYNGWLDGELDVTGDKFNAIIKYLEDNGFDTSKYYSEKYEQNENIE